MSHSLALTWIGIAIALCSSTLAAEKGLGGVSSPYTDAVAQLWLKVDKLEKLAPPSRTLTLKCWTTPGNDTYIGIYQSVLIDASLKTVEQVLDDVPKYTELFEDLVTSEIRDRSGNRFTVFSEQHIPIPFVSNERNELIYEKSAPKPELLKYRYQLKSSNHLKSNDGLIILRALSEKSTSFEEYDFWDAHWGIAKTFGNDRIWKDSAKGVAQADLAIRFKSENPTWSHEKAKEESLRAVDSLPIKDCVLQRGLFPGF